MAEESKMIRDFKAARRVSVPLIAIETTDPASCMKAISGSLTKKTPIISWDRADGFKPLNKEGNAVLAKLLGETEDNWAVVDPDKAIILARKFPGRVVGANGMSGTILFFLNGSLFLNHDHPDNVAACQAVWNLRDEYKQDFRTLIITCPNILLPEELKQDIIILDHPLPTSEEFGKLTTALYKSANLTPKEEDVIKIADASKGLSLFSAEQNIAMSFTEKGIDYNLLSEKKRKTIEQTPGLRIWTGKETFKDVRGVGNMKEFLTMVFNGEERPTVGVFMDELEKQFAGTQGDASGTSEEMHGQFLSWMADEEVMALRMMGHPGCSKSYITKATTGEFQIPLVVLNLSEVKSKYVGESTGQLKVALKTISAIGRPIVMATCNSEEALSPELKDRFNLGTFFFDLPTKDERTAVWDLYMKKYKINSAIPMDEEGWTPRNIRDCCSLAWRLKCTLEKASGFIVPVVRSAPERIEALRRMASGKFLSASSSGVYTFEPKGRQFPVKESLRAIETGSVGEA